jgi:hypothetical protein
MGCNASGGAPDGQAGDGAQDISPHFQGTAAELPRTGCIDPIQSLFLFPEPVPGPYAPLVTGAVDATVPPAEVPPSYRGRYAEIARQVMRERPGWEVGWVRAEAVKRLGEE